jgi:hypothetical protein
MYIHTQPALSVIFAESLFSSSCCRLLGLLCRGGLRVGLSLGLLYGSGLRVDLGLFLLFGSLGFGLSRFL